MSELINNMEKHKGDFLVTLVIWCLEIPINFFLWLSTDDPFILHEPSVLNIFLCSALYVTFILGYLFFYYFQYVKPNNKVAIAGLLVLTLAWLSLSLMFFFSMVALMATIILVQMVDVLEKRWAIIIGLIIPIFCVSMDILLGKPFEFIPIVLYSIINTLSLVASYRLVAELSAKNKSLRLVRELTSAQILLRASTKRDERLRIARDLHDTLGHQLTALSLQLEVASHVPDNVKQDHIKQAQAISRSLLSSVRESVSQIRHEKDVELNALLMNLTQDIPGLKVNLNNRLAEAITDTRKVEVIYRCVQEALTNISKHARAKQCDIELTNDTNNLFINIQDDGQNQNKIIEGNGLKGMKERVTNIDGRLHYSKSARGFELRIQLPVN